ncbi:MAG: hypothetical protein R3298_13065 [Gammaproteobacteria bacterium]|nr:hypothetical protein [Gammaproteobacteria bacterium]
MATDDEDGLRAPGRFCPPDYGYRPADLADADELVAETLYVVGGLYGNLEALDAVEAMAAREKGPVTLVFNGDFHWFDVDEAAFRRVETVVADHHALRGNVETELARGPGEAGCGCAYPEWIDDAVVERSNAILERLATTAAAVPGACERLGALPRYLRARVGDLALAIVHGDAESLAGWGFAQETVDDPAHQQRIRKWFTAAEVDLFASSHTCLPVALCLDDGESHRALVNNGAAGMPNFSGDLRGVITRVGTTASPETPYYGARLGGVHVDALPVAYDAAAWNRDFVASWPPGSPAHASYFTRLTRGPDYRTVQAVRHGVDQKQKCWYSHLSARVRHA